MSSGRKFFIVLLGIICTAVIFLSRERPEEHVMVRIEQDKTVTEKNRRGNDNCNG